MLMGITETLLFYLLVGLVVAVAMFLATGSNTQPAIFLLPTAVAFWPLYLPLLLSGRAKPRAEVAPALPKCDEMATAIAQVETELQSALSSLDGWPEAALAREQSRIGELRTALAAQAARIRELDELLSHTAAEPFSESPESPDSLNSAALERWQKSSRAREQNLSRLAAVRRQNHSDLMATLAWIRELVSMIHLAKFTGAPVSRTEELVAQIAAAVEGVSQVGQQENEIVVPEGLGV